tara:strand:- start:4215 stop:4511 length:297 start_codon:yes stop_codon:yes gene_type:complete
MYVKCNKCDKRILFIELYQCIKCNNKYCNNCLIYGNCNRCLNKLNKNEKNEFCNKYNTNICIHCNDIYIENCHCEGYIENKKTIDEIFDYLINKSFTY